MQLPPGHQSRASIKHALAQLEPLVVGVAHSRSEGGTPSSRVFRPAPTAIRAGKASNRDRLGGVARTQSRFAHIGSDDGVDCEQVAAAVANQQLADDQAWLAVADCGLQGFARVA